MNDPANLAATPLHGIYIPTALIIVGICILNYDYLPHTIAILVVFFTVQFTIAWFKKPVLSTTDFQKYELLDKTVISRNSAIYRFKLPKETDTLDIPVGHHLACRFVIDEKEYVRYYTPISNQFDEGFFDLLVKSYPDGTVSKKFASLYPGQLVEFKGPVGRMSYQSNMASHITMIAGGSGITPMLQVIGSIITTPADVTRVKLIYANETENDILLKEELDEFAEKYPNFEVVYLLNKPQKQWKGLTGYVTKELLEKELPAPEADKRIFVCGPLEMRQKILEYTEELGWPKGTINSKQDDQVFCF
ncbi:hypothetical protein KL905_004637 [Ogataea polymorpha]|uniref:NADH-cytochrome b5 reductase n=1 Tax=Ogataea polymorpha TaxID=460523 RepID=A0A9P8P3C1_9ASCO|nr:hypothetical protein KL908_000593 [Ogataea polymorpha]KAG7903879.1 hypothetical protein KL935_000018 [Ogataea polymorpha]KAG7908617.1 hypothetical protein KL907_002107 [Ogataea polymorpha]KAG7908650.1 hypothetical protein KL906_002881 [Ogataea polymorpha]KAG7916234.1 hypothetical protein KL905_004637 [Ogataea polymorpha]